MTHKDKKPRILIVDDVPGNIKILAEMLTEEYNISMVTNGEEALEMAANKKPDLILLDVIMPGMDGYEVCRRLKADPVCRNIPIIFVTGQREEVDEMRGLELGAVDYVIKPPRAAILKARVKNHIHAKRQRDILSSLSNIDSLTGVGNRRKFDNFLDLEWRRCVRGSLGMAVIMLDIDHFKLYNDHFGHGPGDECLKRIASTLQNSLLRSTDLLARYGGEEFAVILPQVERNGTERVAEKMRIHVESLKVLHPKSKTADIVTISLGCASIFPTRGGSPTPLLESADKMLYAAKEAGRNQFKSCII
jgi:diguanylate cyclase (GGDEF)-like protein